MGIGENDDGIVLLQAMQIVGQQNASMRNASSLDAEAAELDRKIFGHGTRWSEPENENPGGSDKDADGGGEPGPGDNPTSISPRPAREYRRRFVIRCSARYSALAAFGSALLPA